MNHVLWWLLWAVVSGQVFAALHVLLFFMVWWASPED